MILRFLLSLLAGCFAFQAVFAQSDTLSTKLEAVEITADNSFFAVGSRHLLLDSLDLKQYQSSSLSDLLQKQTPLYLKTYGTGTSTISIRGTKAEHTALLWNGLNITLPTLGLSDFATIPVSGLTNVALQYGPASANYGSASIGGTVLLNSGLKFNQGIKAELQAEAGSFGYRYFSGSAGFSSDKFASRTTIFSSEADNDFPYTDISAFKRPVKKVENAGFKQKGFSQDLEYKISDRTKVALREWVTQTERQIQAAMGSNHANARQDDENIRLMADINHLSAFGETTLKTAYFNDVLNYYSDQTQSESEVQTYQVQADHAATVLPKLNLNAGVNAQKFVAWVDGYGERKKEHRNAAYMLLRYDPFPGLHLNLNWRQQWMEGYGTTPAPALAAEYKLFQKGASAVQIKGNIARSYRVPTLNERFWPTGNPNLKPENGWGHEAGSVYRYEKAGLKITTEATYFYLKVNDWVQWEAMGNGWTPTNLQTVISEGAEASASAKYSFRNITANLQAGYQFTNTSQVAGAEPDLLHKQLIYVPVHAANTSIGINWKGWYLNGQAGFTGERFINYANTQAVPAFMIITTLIGKEFTLGSLKLNLSGRINNLTNQEYQNLYYRAMPLRNYSLALRINYIKP